MEGKGETAVHLLRGKFLEGLGKQNLGWGLGTHRGLSDAFHQGRAFLGEVRAVNVGSWLPAGGCSRGSWQPCPFPGLASIAHKDARPDILSAGSEAEVPSPPS